MEIRFDFFARPFLRSETGDSQAFGNAKCQNDNEVSKRTVLIFQTRKTRMVRIRQ